MRQLNIKLTERQHERLRRYASGRRTPVAWLIKDYVDSLIDGDVASAVRTHETTQLAARGGSFDWLADEPELYDETDGDAIVERPSRGRR